jgi:hypothetical protein
MLQSNFVSRRMGVLLAFVAALAAADCGGGSPSSPDVAQARGAIIRGSVQDSSTSGSDGGSLSASSTSRTLKVSVVGTNLSTSTNGSGEFVLTGVPTGRVELRFEGPGLDARLEIGGLSDGQEIRITVRVNGSGVVLVSGGGSSGPSPSPSPSPSPDDDDDDVEFTGRLDAINGATLTVAGRTVVTDATTLIRRRGDPVPFSALQVGQILEVEGSPQTNSSVLARKITIEDDDDDADEDEDDEDDDDDDEDDDEEDDDEDEDDEDED